MAQDSALLGGTVASPGAPAAAGVGGGSLGAASMTPAPNEGTPMQPPAPPSFPDKMLSEAKARYDAVEKVTKQLGRTRKGLDALIAKGDVVTSDDVLDEMATLVAHGADPKALAAMIAGNTEAGVGPMPPGGEPLAGWLRNAEGSIVAPMEAQLRPALALAQHQLGVAAMHKMIEVHGKMQGAGQGGQAPQAASPAPASPALAPSPPPFASPPPSPLLH